MLKNTSAGQGSGHPCPPRDNRHSHFTALTCPVHHPLRRGWEASRWSDLECPPRSWNLHSRSNGGRLETPWVVTLCGPSRLAECVEPGLFDGGRGDERGRLLGGFVSGMFPGSKGPGSHLRCEMRNPCGFVQRILGALLAAGRAGVRWFDC